MKGNFRKLKERLKSDVGDTITISQLLWIVGIVVLVGVVGTAIYNAVKAKSDKMADCINKSNNLFTGTADPDCGQKTTP